MHYLITLRPEHLLPMIAQFPAEVRRVVDQHPGKPVVFRMDTEDMAAYFLRTAFPRMFSNPPRLDALPGGVPTRCLDIFGDWETRADKEQKPVAVVHVEWDDAVEAANAVMGKMPMTYDFHLWLPETIAADVSQVLESWSSPETRS